MRNKISLIAFLALAAVLSTNCFAAGNPVAQYDRFADPDDSAAVRRSVTSIINTVIKASGSFDIESVADLYAPNAVVADEEPPFSWNGPTAGVQWVNTVQKTCKDLKLKGLKGKIGRINVYLQTDESIYVVVPVSYTGEIRGEPFEEDGAFSFIFRLVNDKWLIKSQVWITRRGM